jgi:hypothetical protein
MKLTESEMTDLYRNADAVGQEAAAACNPTPMLITGYAPISDGVCGFAWITIRPGNSRFANWLKRNDHARKAYGGGVSVWVGGYGQSMERKSAYAQAFALYLRNNGIPNAYAGSRMD